MIKKKNKKKTAEKIKKKKGNISQSSGKNEGQKKEILTALLIVFAIFCIAYIAKDRIIDGISSADSLDADANLALNTLRNLNEGRAQVGDKTCMNIKDAIIRNACLYEAVNTRLIEYHKMAQDINLNYREVIGELSPLCRRIDEEQLRIRCNGEIGRPFLFRS
jgi:hypothetical protein